MVARLLQSSGTVHLEFKHFRQFNRRPKKSSTSFAVQPGFFRHLEAETLIPPAKTFSVRLSMASLTSDTEEQKSVWRDNPTAQLEYRKSLENPANKQQYEMYQKDGPVQKNVRQMLTTQMQTAFQDHSELLKLIPDWAVGCRRPSPAPGYIDALTKPNVQVIMDKVQVTQKGIVVNGTEIEVDAIVCATGFNPKFLPRYRMVGRNGIDLETQWYGDGRKPEAYMCLAIPNFPNSFSMFFLSGINGSDVWPKYSGCTRKSYHHNPINESILSPHNSKNATTRH